MSVESVGHTTSEAAIPLDASAVQAPAMMMKTSKRIMDTSDLRDVHSPSIGEHRAILIEPRYLDVSTVYRHISARQRASDRAASNNLPGA